MFTGLVRDVGKITVWQRRSNSVCFAIETKLPLTDLQLGASVACNGACLTVISSEQLPHSEKNIFSVEAGPQTIELTRLGAADFAGVGEMINLEPALRMGDALGGHLLSGHVDTLGQVLVNEPTNDGFWRLRVSFESSFANYIVKKGSIGLAGVSLTIAECSQTEHESWVEIMLIPHTLAHTNLQNLKVGSCLEIEFDSQAKLVADLLKVMLPMQLKSILKQK